MEKEKIIIIQIISLFLIQWLSIAVIILNASALNKSKDSSGGLIMASETGPQDFILLVMAVSSLLAVSLLLCLYLQIFLRLLGNRRPTNTTTVSSSLPSKRILYVEIAFSLIITFIWTAATVVVLRQYNASSSCRDTFNISTASNKVSFENTNRNRLSSTACNLVDATIAVAFTTIGLWFVALITSLYSLLSLNNYSLYLSSSTPIHPYENVSSKTQTISPRSSIVNPCSTKQQQHKHDPVLYNDNNNNLRYCSTMTTIATEEEGKDLSQKIFVITCPTEDKKNANNTLKKDKEILSTSTPVTIMNSNSPLQIQQEQKRSHNNSNKMMQKTSTANNYYFPREPELIILKTKKKQHDWDFDFEPINIDLMLPTTNELIGDSSRKRDIFYK